MYHYKPTQILVEEEARNLPFTRSVLNKLKDVPVKYLEAAAIKNRDGLPDNSGNLTKGKKTLLIKTYKASPVKLCPGYSTDVVCCNYHVLDFIENCPLECTYCILQAYHNRPEIVFHANVEEILEKIGHTMKVRQKQSFRIGTGEHSDSLALDSLFNLNPTLVEFFGEIPNSLLELKTKSDYVRPLLGLNHKGRTIVSWSVNSEVITNENEFKTARLDERLEAARLVVEDGYKVGFHFDPLIEHDNWQENYLKTVRKISERIPAESIAWLSMGTLRYTPSLKPIAEERFTKTDVFAGEFINAADGKKRYLKKIREELLNTVGSYLKEYFPTVRLYLCMENSSIWKQTLSRVPKSDLALEAEIYSGGSIS